MGNTSSKFSRVVAIVGSTIALIALLVVLPGCLTHEDPNTFRVEGRAPSSPPPVVPGAYGYPPEPPVTNSVALHDFVARFRHHVVLLDFWATWCSRCRDEMPRIVRLQDELRPSGFQVISCSLDEPQHWSGQIVPALQSVNASFPCVTVPRSAKSPLRSWLGNQWDYTLPARFVIDGDGNVVARLYADATVEQAVSEVERAVRGSTGGSQMARASGAAELQLRLIEISTGRATVIPTIFSNPANSGLLATKAADTVAARVGRRTRRIAILAFHDRADPGHPLPFGSQVADEMVGHLRRLGYMDLLEPPATRTEVAGMELTPASIEFDPSVIKGRLGADFLVLGWLAGAPGEVSSPPSRRMAVMREKPARP